jgi:hypothetical protein
MLRAPAGNGWNLGKQAASLKSLINKPVVFFRFF